MNAIKKFFIPALALGLFAACSDDNKFDGPETPAENVDGLYMTLTVSQASMSRTSSPSNIEEAGQTDENNVNNMLLIIVDKNSTVVDYARVSTKIPGSQTGAIVKETDGSYTATGQFNRNNMISYLQSTPSTNDTRFYVVCNPTEAQEFTVGQNIDDFICSKGLDTYASTNKFVMSNSSQSTVSLPTLSDVQAGAYSTPENAFKIADTEVERVVARFDYAEYITESTAEGNKGNYYFVLSDARNDEVKDGKLNVSIKKLALVNMGKEFYLFKRVNNDGLKTTPAVMFGAETSTNYVVGPWGTEKAALNAAGDDFDTYFSFHVSNPSSWSFADVSAIITDDNKRGDENGNLDATTGNYYFWRYSLTNNLPADPKVTQKNGNSTGIVFRAEITTPDTEGDLKTAMAAGNAIYAFAGEIIGDYTALKKFISKDAAHAISVAYNNAGLTDTEKEAATSTPEIDKKLVGNKFTIYRANNGHYYCDYYYWNRHNDNNKDNEMGPMEFAVVRNNIYKLAVTEIAKLGHPTIKDDDPDPIKPDTPDETSDFYMKVKVSVKKWGVRVNKIKF